MLEAARSSFEAWENFYVIIGSSAGALIGLQFVVITLIADVEVPSTHASIGAFGTPTIVHFAATVLISAAMSTPWPNVAHAGLVFALIGIAGIAYVAINMRRAQVQKDYQPVWQDWLWHFLLPFIAYLLLPVAAFALSTHIVLGLFLVAGAALSLLFIGIHNAWDTVLFIVIDRGQSSKPKTTS
ncbi:MAG TPA: hypothetical protein VIP11_07065 [Gemmatimonadaceae bacterium]